jgi:hypothetical protein
MPANGTGGGGGAAAAGPGASVLGLLGVSGVSHRALPQLCQQLEPYCPLTTRRRAVLGLGEVLRGRSLDAGTALELLRRCQCVPLLVDLLYGGAGTDQPHPHHGGGGGGGGFGSGSGSSGGSGGSGSGGGAQGPGGAAAVPGVGPRTSAAVAALSATKGSGRVAPAPTQPDAVVRDGALHLLAQIAYLGGLDLLTPVQTITAALGGALVSTEPSARAQAAEFWRAASVWEVYAGAFARAIFPLGGVRSAGVRVEGQGAFTNGIAVLLALTRREHEGGWGTSLACAQAAAAALVNTLEHSALRPLWTTRPETISYLIRLDDDQIARIRELPARLATPA